MQHIRLRPATPNDSDFAYGTKKLALGQYVTETHGWDEDDQRILHQRRFRPVDTQIIVHDGRDVGLLTMHREPDRIHLRQLFLLPEVQNQGIGTYLVRQILAESQERRVLIALQVLKTNRHARAFYERHGFCVVGETDTHHQMRYRPR